MKVPDGPFGASSMMIVQLSSTVNSRGQSLLPCPLLQLSLGLYNLSFPNLFHLPCSPALTDCLPSHRQDSWLV